MNRSLQNVAAALDGEVSGDQVLAPGPGHSREDRSLSVKLVSSAPDGLLVYSFASDDWRTCKDHVIKCLGIDDEWKCKPAQSEQVRQVLDFNTAKKQGEIRRKAKLGRVVVNYDYLLADGTPYVRAVRYESKDFRQQHWTGTAWEYGGAKGDPIPYRLPEMKAAVHDTVFVVEGEKDADNLAKRGFVATTNIGGAGNWKPALNQHFVGKIVYILPDNDKAGADHAVDVARHLYCIATSVRIVNLPGLPHKGDVSDWIEAGGDLSGLVDLCKAVPVYSGQADQNAGAAEVGAGQTDSQGEQNQRLIKSSADFIAGFVPPDYLIDGLLQRRFCYSLTAPTGHGKTAVALFLAATTALGQPMGDYPVEQGRVLYLAGENPDDVRMRWLLLADVMNFDHTAIDVHFLAGVFKLTKIGQRIRAEVEQIGPVALVVVDTSAAYFEGDAENDNVQLGNHARLMRGLVTLPGEPTVLVACHPVKNAGTDNLLPRGGGAFLAEVDGNLTCWRNDGVVILHWQGKFRGPDFAPVPFALASGTTDALRDSKGHEISTVYAKPMSDKERSEAEAKTRGDEDALLIAIAENDRSSMNQLASALNWRTRDHKPNKSRVQRTADRLKKGGLVKVERGCLMLTEKGKNEAARAKYNADAKGASYD